MNPKLMALPIAALVNLRNDINEAYKARRYEIFKIGSLAQFEKGGRLVRVRITGRGPTNLQCVEVDERGSSTGKKWRCHPNAVDPIVEAPKPPAPPLYAGADRPSIAGAGSF